MEKLDIIDRKILFHLDQNSRDSISNIAKRCRVHKNVVNFRIKRLQEKGVIRNFVAMVSPSTLGLMASKVYIRMQNLTPEKEAEFFDYIKKFPVYWAARTFGRWDFIVGILTKTMAEVDAIKSKILHNFSVDITDKHVSFLVQAPHFYRDYLLNKTHTDVKYWIHKNAPSSIDHLDRKIVEILAKNSRTTATDMAKALKVSVKTTIVRIRRLQKDGIIYDYRISLNLNKIGYHFFKCLISFKDTSDLRTKAFIEYCKSRGNIVHVVQCLGDWDIEPEWELSSTDKFYEELENMRIKFNDIIKNVEPIQILREYNYVCVPKL